MKRIRTAGLCLAATFAISAVLASGAVAQPTYKACRKLSKNPVTKKFDGHFTNSTCSAHATATQEAEGKVNKYDLGAWNEGKEATPKFKLKGGRSTLFIYVKGVGVVGSVTCVKDKGEGHITGPSSGNVTVVFEKCVNSSGGVCTSVGEATGKIKTALLDTEIAESAGGSVVERVGWAGASSATFNCGSEHVETTGTADGVVTGNVNVVSPTSTQTFTVNAGGEQENTVAGDVLLAEIGGVGTFEAGEQATTVTTGQALEIEAAGSAPVWWVGGQPLAGAEAIAEATNLAVPFKLEFALDEGKGPKFTIECMKEKVQGAVVESPGTRTETAEIYEGCSVVGQPACVVATIGTEPLKATLEGPAGAEKLKFVPKSGTRIAAYTISGSGCGEVGNYEADGAMICGYNGVEAEGLEHPLEFTATSGTAITVNGQPAALTETDEVHLASGKTWSAF
jgi:hypothetical protein